MLRLNFAPWREKLAETLTARLDAAGRAGAEHARSIVPIDTGATEASIGYYVIQDASGGPSVVIYAGTPYAGFVEFGTSKMAARPFLRPALDAAEEVLMGGGGAMIQLAGTGPFEA